MSVYAVKKWEHDRFWLNRDLEFASPAKRKETGDDRFVLSALTPLKKAKMTQAIRDHANSIFTQYKEQSGVGRVFVPVVLVGKHKWVPSGHVMYICVDHLDVVDGDDG